MKPLVIVHLYPEDMNIYGDTGNLIVLKKRLSWRNIPFEVSRVNDGDNLPKSFDLLIGGGGQDAGQKKVEADLQKKAIQLREATEAGVPMLLVCGLYQLFGREFVTSDSSIIKGIGILPVTTSAGEQRIIGNCVVQTEDFGELVGYENHSGQTFLDEGASPLGKALPNSGNNGVDMTEGARYANTFGTYLHGPILSKNPRFSDALISMALMHMGSPHTTLTELDDSLENQAAEFAKTRQR